MNSNIDGQKIAQCVDRFRKHRPHIHCITNVVAHQLTANAILAAGGTPSMTIAEEEIADFVNMADALLINLGTMDKARTRSIEIAVGVAKQEQKAWAMDPVFVQASPSRLELAKRLFASGPSVVRCNKDEFEALFELSVDEMDQKGFSADTAVALTGRRDRVVTKSGITRSENGSPLMHSVTAMGCALGGVMAGFSSMDEEPLLTATAALVFFGLSGEHAQKKSNGPGTFVPHFLDALSNLDSHDIAAGAKLL